MKKIVTNLLFIVLFVFIGSSCEKMKEYYYNMVDIYGNEVSSFKTTFWTDTGSEIDVYIDNKLYGKITKSFSSVPECETSGCVTFTSYTEETEISFYCESFDGKFKWEKETYKLSKANNSVKLFVAENGVMKLGFQ